MGTGFIKWENAEIWDRKRAGNVAEESGMAVDLADCWFGRANQPQFILGEDHDPI